jgi:hypothetical protein
MPPFRAQWNGRRRVKEPGAVMELKALGAALIAGTLLSGTASAQDKSPAALGRFPKLAHLLAVTDGRA